MTDQEKQMSSMGSVMGVVFAFLFYNAPSGLTIYWIFNTLFTILQQQWTNARTPAAPVPEIVTKKGKSKKG